MYYSPYFSMPKWWLFLANSRKYVSRSPNFHSLSKTMPTFLLIDFNRNSSSKETLANVFLFDSNWGSFATGRMIMMDQKVSGDRLPHQSAGVGPQHTINSTWLRRRDVACQLAAGQKIHELSFFNLAQQVPFLHFPSQFPHLDTKLKFKGNLMRKTFRNRKFIKRNNFSAVWYIFQMPVPAKRNDNCTGCSRRYEHSDMPDRSALYPHSRAVPGWKFSALASCGYRRILENFEYYYCIFWNLPEYGAKHLAHHAHLGALEVLTTFAEGSQDAVTSIIAHAKWESKITKKKFNARFLLK